MPAKLLTRRIGRWDLALLGGLALFVGQYLLDHSDHPAVALVPFAVAALVVWRLLGKVETEPALAPDASAGRVRWALVAPALALSGFAFARLGGNRYSALGTGLWVLGIGFLLAAAWRRPLRSEERPASSISGQGVRVTWVHVALAGIMLLGGWLRLARIDRVPLEMGCDLPHIYNNIRLLLRSEFLVFFDSYPGREGLFFYLAAPLCRAFGLNYTTIKISAALIGVGTLPAVYWLGCELYDREVGLWAALLLSVSHWHVILTRVGFRSCTMPLLLCLGLACWARAQRSGRRWFYALAGLFLGLGLHTYNAFLIVPLVMVLMGLCLWLRQGRAFWRQWDGLLLMAGMALYVFLPLGRYAFDNPQQYLFRVATRVTGAETALPTSPLLVLAQTSLKALLMFNYRGDAVFINNVPFVRELGFMTAMLLVVGVVYAAVRWKQGFNGWLLLGLLGMLLPTSLSLAFPGEVPNAGRAIGALPLAMILAGLGLTLVRRQVAALVGAMPVHRIGLTLQVDGAARWNLSLIWGRMRRATWIVVLVLALALEARATYRLYFGPYWAHLPDGGYSITLDMAQAIDAMADDGESYIKAEPYWYDGNAVRAQLRREEQSWNHELPQLVAGQPPLDDAPGKFMVILHPDNQAALQTLQQAFPQGIATRHTRAASLPDQGRPVAFITFYGEKR